MEAVHDAIHAATEHVAEHAAGAVSHPPELPNFIHLLHNWLPGNFVTDTLLYFMDQIFALLVIGVIALFFSAASKNCSIIPGRLQALAEMLLEGLYGIISGILGEKEGRQYFPFLASLFIFIICMNWFGLIPLMRSPTSNICVTAGLAVCVFGFVQYSAFKRLGPNGYLYHLLGEPKDAIGWAMTPLFLPLHILEEFIKPLSLACRLYGNVFGEDVLLGVGMTLGAGLMLYIWPGTFFGFPFHFPFVLLAILLSAIQALVFTLLATVYISMVIPHEHHEEGHE